MLLIGCRVRDNVLALALQEVNDGHEAGQKEGRPKDIYHQFLDRHIWTKNGLEESYSFLRALIL